MTSLTKWVNWKGSTQRLLDTWPAGTRRNDMRLGQTLFNKLYQCNPEVADLIRGTSADPFHNDNIIPAFLERVDELWEQS